MQTLTALQTEKLHHSEKIAEELIHFLADTYTLYLKTQNFHWNVTGTDFYSLHHLFETQYQELALAVDEIAERIRALGSYTPASFEQFMNLASLKEQLTAVSAQEMVKQLGEDHETMEQYANKIIQKAKQVEDEGTVDMLIQRVKAHEKAAWMLKSSIRK